MQIKTKIVSYHTANPPFSIPWFVAQTVGVTWYALWNPRPSSVLADGRGVVGLLELRQAADVDGVGVGNARPRGPVGHEPVGDVRDDARSCKVDFRLLIMALFKMC